MSWEESKNVNLELSREAIHYQQHLQETISTSCCDEQQKLEKHEQRCSEVKRKKWAKWAILTAPTPPTPPCTPVKGTSLISEEKWSLRSLLSFKGDIWWMGGWTDPSDENLRGWLQMGAVHCPGLPWKPLYMLNLLLCPVWPQSNRHVGVAKRKRRVGKCVLPALPRPLSLFLLWHDPPPQKKKKCNSFFLFRCKVVFAKLRVCRVSG